MTPSTSARPTDAELLGVLNAARIALKSRDQSSFEMKVLDGIKVAIALLEGAPTPSTPASTDAELADQIDDGILSESDGYYAPPLSKAQWRTISAALRSKASPQEMRGDEPVATYYTEGKDAAYFEALADAEFSERANKAAMDIVDSDFGPIEEHMPIVAILSEASKRLNRLLAAPNQSPRLEREGIARALYDLHPGIRWTQKNGKTLILAASWEEATADERADDYAGADAILALLSPDTTVVLSTLRAHVEPCPKCGSNMDGGPIPEDIRNNYSPPYRWSRKIGIYDRGEDATIAWECPDCKGRWPTTVTSKDRGAE